MSAPAFQSVITNLVSAFQSAGSLSGVRIFDGLEIDSSYPGDAIAVGHDGTIDAEEINAGDFTQTYAPIGARNKMESGVVNCWLWSVNGLTDISARRAAAYSILAAAEAVIRTDPSLGGTCLYSGLSQSTTKYRQTQAGAAVLVNFQVSYEARI
jgi:hypothetical protein